MISFHNQGKPRCLWTNSQEFKLGGHLRRELPGATESTTTPSTLKAVWESWSSWTFNKDSQGRFKHIWDYSAKPLIQLGYQIAKPKLRDLVSGVTSPLSTESFSVLQLQEKKPDWLPSHLPCTPTSSPHLLRSWCGVAAGHGVPQTNLWQRWEEEGVFTCCYL